MEYMRSQLSEHDSKIKNQQSKIKDLSQAGSWCATGSNHNPKSSVIKYHRIFHEDSNMNEEALNSNTLNNYGLDIGTGETLK